MNFIFSTKRLLSLSLALALADHALALTSQFRYQGFLEEGGLPANGSYDLQFLLQTRTGTPLTGPLQIDDVPVVDGVFTVQLDFGAAIGSADYQMQIGVRPGTSTAAYTLLLPPSLISPPEFDS